MTGADLRLIVPFARPILQATRELPVLIRALKPGRGIRVVFMPAYGCEGSARLRIYNIAATLRSWGWDVHLLPWNLTLGQRHRCLMVLRPDLVVMQGTRNSHHRPALYPGQKIILDLDDGDFHLPHLAASVQEAMPQVAGVIAGSRYIANWCLEAGVPKAHVVWTGAPVSRRPWRSQHTRLPVVVWAQTRPMDYEHEAALVRRVMRRVARKVDGVTLRLYDRCPGDDPGFAGSFEAPGLTVEWRERARYRDYLESFGDAAVGLAPLVLEDPFCRGKSFGKLLAYLDRGVPVIASDVGEPTNFFSAETGRLCATEEDWVADVTWLLTNAQSRQQIAQAGFQAFKRSLSIDASAAGVADVLLMTSADEAT